MTIKLFLRLEKVSTISPQISGFERDECGTRRAGKARYKGATSVSRRRIFAIVGVSRGDDEGKKVSFAELFAQSEERGCRRDCEVGLSSAKKAFGLETSDSA